MENKILEILPLAIGVLGVIVVGILGLTSYFIRNGNMLIDQLKGSRFPKGHKAKIIDFSSARAKIHKNKPY